MGAEVRRDSAVLLDAMGTLVRLDDPVGRLRAALRSRTGADVGSDGAARALRAEIAYYRAHLHTAVDPPSLAALRAACAEAMRPALPEPVAVRAAGAAAGGADGGDRVRRLRGRRARPARAARAGAAARRGLQLGRLAARAARRDGPCAAPRRCGRLGRGRRRQAGRRAVRARSRAGRRGRAGSRLARGRRPRGGRRGRARRGAAARAPGPRRERTPAPRDVPVLRGLDALPALIRAESAYAWVPSR